MGRFCIKFLTAYWLLKFINLLTSVGGVKAASLENSRGLMKPPSTNFGVVFPSPLSLLTSACLICTPSVLGTLLMLTGLAGACWGLCGLNWVLSLGVRSVTSVGKKV